MSGKNGQIKTSFFVGGEDSLVIDRLTQKFGSLVAIEDLSLRVRSGVRKAILGANGAGKTTLFNAITGDIPPTQGKVFFFGEEISDWTVFDRIRGGLRRTYQKSLLFGELKVIDNLYLACQGVRSGRFGLKRPHTSKYQSNMLDQAYELAKFVHLQREVNMSVKDLSYGKQRQLEIGMALAGSPRLILFDEPAAGLSVSERIWLIDLLQQLPANLDFAIIEHDLDVALRVADQVTVMDNGRVFKEGSPEEIQDDHEVQKIYLGT